MDPDQRIIYSIIARHVEGDREEKQGPWSLIESFDLGTREVVSLVGAGGKTTLMFQLAKELVSAGKRVVTTTTTKILEPSSQETPCLYVHRDEEKLLEWILKHLDEFRHITLARERVESRKLKGISVDLVRRIGGCSKIDVMIIEADGAAGRSVKAPREWEPVVPQETTLVIGLMGVDAVGKELNDVYFFQAERISELTGIPLGEKMTPEGLAIVATHPQGLFKGAPHSSRKILLINKVDLPEGRRWGREVGEEVLRKGSLGIERIVLGHVRSVPPVAEVFISGDLRR